MLKWQDPLSQKIEIKLKTLADHLRKIKSQGWSVIFSENEIVVRPGRRAIGKFSIAIVRDGRFSISFFSRELNIWNKRKYFEANFSHYGTGDYEDPAEAREDQQGEFYYLQFGSPVKRGEYPSQGGCYLSIEEAEREAEGATHGTVRWND